MTVRIVWSTLARQELLEACRWYRIRAPELDAAMIENVRRVVSFMGRHPQASPVLNKQYRKAAVPGFPYCLIYRLSESTIQLVSFWPDRRDPAVLKAVVATVSRDA